jgi:hypothetical protein
MIKSLLAAFTFLIVDVDVPVFKNVLAIVCHR